MNKIHQLLGHAIENVETKNQERPGWTQVVLTENYENKKVSLASKDISDGNRLFVETMTGECVRNISVLFMMKFGQE